jgi:hypothetical protein
MNGESYRSAYDGCWLPARAGSVNGGLPQLPSQSGELPVGIG